MAHTVVSTLQSAHRPFETGMATHVGAVRTRNEDNLLARPEIGLWAVADGMGGHDAGDVASKAVVDALMTVGPPHSAGHLLAQCEREITTANRTLVEMGARHGGLVGTTIAALLVHGEHFACVWAGDSRVYLLRDRAISACTRDHSEVQELVSQGRLTPTEARNWPHRNAITRAVGVREKTELEISNGILKPGDIFVLCTDGLTNHVEDHEILAIAAANSPQRACNALIDLTLSRGASDNVTAVVMRY